MRFDDGRVRGRFRWRRLSRVGCISSELTYLSICCLLDARVAENRVPTFFVELAFLFCACLMVRWVLREKGRHPWLGGSGIRGPEVW